MYFDDVPACAGAWVESFSIASRTPPPASYLPNDTAVITMSNTVFTEVGIWRPSGYIPYVPGDANGSGARDISDALWTLNYLFLGQGRSDCLSAADINVDAQLDISDPVALLQGLFLGGSLPEPTCHGEPADDLGCDDYDVCPPVEDDRCADLSAESIEFEILEEYGNNIAEVRVHARFRNIGGHYQAGSDPHEVWLLENGQLVTRHSFTSVAAGEEIHMDVRPRARRQ